MRSACWEDAGGCRGRGGEEGFVGGNRDDLKLVWGSARPTSPQLWVPIWGRHKSHPVKIENAQTCATPSRPP